MPLSIKVNLRVTGHCNQGGRKYMEDMFSVAYQQTSDDKDLEYAFFGIFDGHGGGEAATFAKEHLMDIIVKQRNFWSDKDEDVLRAIRDGYVNTHYAMWRELDKWPRTASGLPSTAGTTASVAFIRKGKIYIGHVGDSGIILGYQDEDDPQWKARALTKDHKPESGPEMMRIQESGGKVVSKSGVPRVVWNRPRIGHKGPVRRSTHIDEIPFLAVARSLGDLWSYNSELDTFVVSPEPDVKVVTVDLKSHRCLIFGTDGLWNMLTPQAAVGIVQAAERHNEKHLIASQQTGNPHADVQMWINPSKSLVDRALEKWSLTRLRADNTSVVTLMLDPPGPSRSEVLMSRKKECEPSPKSISTPFYPQASNTPVDTVVVPLNEPILNPLTSVLPNNLEIMNAKNPDSSIDAYESLKINNTTDKVEEVKDIAGSIQAANENLEVLNDKPENVLASTSRESIQVAEISSSDASNDIVDVRTKDPKIANLPDVSTKEVAVEGDSEVPFQGGPSKLDYDITPDVSLVLNNNTSLSDDNLLSKEAPVESLSNLMRQNAFCGSCDELKSGPRLRRTAGTCNNLIASSLDSSHDQDQSPVIPIGGTATAPKRRQSQGSSLGSHLESRRVRRRQSVNSITYLSERQPSFPSPVGARLKREVGLRSYRERTIETIEVRTTRTLTNTTTESKRRHSSTTAPVEDEECGVQEPSAKRRTRSEDRPNPIDENDPANQEKPEQQKEQHSRLRWPEESGVSARSRSGSMSGFCGTTGVSSNGQEKLCSPNSFQRRSLEKKATPVKTIRRPSINGSSRVQLRGSFALRDWDQSKSGRRSSCNDRSRLNRTVGGVIGSTTDSSPAPSLQRWLRSDTLAATPVKTLRSRKVDIVTGHTVPAQLAHQYGVTKQNRLSLSAKIKLAGKVSKSSSSALSTTKLPKQSPVNNGTGSTTNGTGSSTGSGITKRVKSPYNPSARSALGTRSRLKRLGK